MRGSPKNRRKRYLRNVKKIAIELMFALLVGFAIYLGYWETGFILIGLYAHKKLL